MIKNVKSTAQAGFTLIELVVVIVILGILAATALPKVSSMSTEARGGVMQGVAGAVNSAAVMAYAKSAATGTAAYPAAGAIAGLVELPDGVEEDSTTAGLFKYTSAPTPAGCSVQYNANNKATVTTTGC